MQTGFSNDMTYCTVDNVDGGHESQSAYIHHGRIQPSTRKSIESERFAFMNWTNVDALYYSECHRYILSWDFTIVALFIHSVDF